jgi:HEAT repeat protein
MLAALEDVRTAGPAAAPAVPVVVDLLQRGLDAPLTQAALDALAAVESEGASEVLGAYARHRVVSIRRSAVMALGKTKGPQAVKALRVSLGDKEEAVRKEAALALGALKAKEAMDDLVLAMDKHVPGAAQSVGQVCTTDCEKLLVRMGQLPFAEITAGLDQALFRADVADEFKVKAIAKVRELGTSESNKFLKEVQRRWPEKGSPRVKKSIDDAVSATSGSP